MIIAYLITVRACISLLFKVRFWIDVLSCLVRRVRRTLFYLHCPYLSPEVMIQLARRGRDTSWFLLKSACIWYMPILDISKDLGTHMNNYWPEFQLYHWTFLKVMEEFSYFEEHQAVTSLVLHHFFYYVKLQVLRILFSSVLFFLSTELLKYNKCNKETIKDYCTTSPQLL